MGKKIKRRTFIKKSALAGMVGMIAINSFAELALQGVSE